MRSSEKRLVVVNLLHFQTLLAVRTLSETRARNSGKPVPSGLRGESGARSDMSRDFKDWQTPYIQSHHAPERFGTRPLKQTLAQMRLCISNHIISYKVPPSTKSHHKGEG